MVLRIVCFIALLGGSGCLDDRHEPKAVRQSDAGQRPTGGGEGEGEGGAADAGLEDAFIADLPRRFDDEGYFVVVSDLARAGCAFHVSPDLSGHVRVSRDGPSLTMAFEMATFTGTIRDSGRFLVERRHEFDYQDGCHWVGRDVIEGAMPSLDGFTGEHRYEEWPKRGEQCARACLDITSRLSGSRGIR